MTDADSTAGLTVVHDAAELAADPGEGTDIIVLEDTTFTALDGEVAAVGPTAEVLTDYPIEGAETTIDATDETVLPGLVDPHTRALFAGGRFDEFVAKLQDATHKDILANDDGVLHTVDAIRGVSDGGLVVTLADHLDAILAHGTTTVEVRTGYGPDIETRLRMLSATDTAGSDHPVDMVPTSMGAHAVPRGAGAEEYIESVVSGQLPVVAAWGIAEFYDVFCERGAFATEQSRRILDTSRDHGLTPKIHTDEFAVIGGTDVAASVDAVNTDHLLHTDDEGRNTLVSAGVTPVLLPDTAFGLGTDYTDTHAFLDAGYEVAFATDFNPNCFARSMSFVATLASVGTQMTPHEVIRGITGAAADALDRDDGTDILRAGAPADAAVLDVPTASHPPYRFDTNPVSTVLKSEVVARE